MKYILDTNIFITSAKRHYGFTFVPGFWDWLVEKNSEGILCSCEPVKIELLEKDDEISNWAKNQKQIFIAQPESFEQSMTEIAVTISAGVFPQPAKNKFLSGVDYQLLGYAKALGLVVVSHEVSAPDKKKDIKLPDACKAVGVECISPFELLKVENAQLVLSKPRNA